MKLIEMWRKILRIKTGHTRQSEKHKKLYLANHDTILFVTVSVRLFYRLPGV